jgi:cyclic dehypoxanthinyl futalosine synthase
VIYDVSLDSLMQKVWDGRRIDSDEAARLYRLPLEELGALADRRRQLAKADAWDNRGNDIVTYIIDCNFWRSEKASDAYVISHDEIDQKIRETVDLGGTQILMQGGHHPKLSKQWYLDLLSHIRDKWPTVNIHAFSPSEFIAFSEFFNEPVDQLIREFSNAGLGSIPGGGGEILVDSVRNRVSPLKAMTDDWLHVMDVAHTRGLATTVTMMFGHVETLAHRIEHLDRVRQQQDISIARLAAGQSTPSPTGRPGGKFSAFICWNFQAEGTKLKAPTVGASEYLRTQALSRIYLDNIDNIQSSWVTQGLDIGQIALKYGANDLGSIMIEENVVSQAGTTFQMSVADMKRLITDLQYQPRQRDNWYNLLN